ncbi:hypothetical protein EXM22_16175 [Oceanispirochaeta crateris]|uniref:Uncharacterized protein n=1 Tax=Oceanispirochaeta crateris TaxID=2518645 RepID=A0A5C1QP41_9SPIO|nr:hypothetical protein [Oceanispirochaeta crateris]QEN09441.1 hypothetical protein EXM22_16175 [Oceanispirochaeta crateris]
MFVISLIFYAFIVIYVVSISFRYYYSRHALKKREQKIRKGKTPIRTANASEIVGLRWMFGVQVPSNTEVYKTEGAIESLTLKGRYSVYREFWVNGIQIQSRRSPRKSQDDKLIENILDEKESLICEYILDSRGKAFPVCIGSYSITTNFEEERSFSGQLIQPRWHLRDATPRERQALIKTVRWPSILLLLPTAPLFLGSFYMKDMQNQEDALFLLTAGSVLMILSFLIQAWRAPSRKGEDEICSVSGRWEKIKSRNPRTHRYGLKGTDIRLTLSRAAKKNLSEERLRGEVDIFFKKKALTGRVSCKLVRADSYDLDQRLRSRIIKAPRCWVPFFLTLFFTGLTVFSITMYDKPWSLLAAIPGNLKNGPRVLHTPEETQNLKEGETIRFEKFLIQPVDYIISGGFLPVSAPMDLFEHTNPAEQELTESLKQHWTEFSRSMNSMFRHADGSKLDLDAEQFYYMDSKTVICKDPGRLMQYLSQDHRYNARMPLDDVIVNPAYSRDRINWLVQNLASNVKMGIYDEAGIGWKRLQLSNSHEQLRTTPYPLFIYADFPLPEALSRENKVEREKNLYLLPIDELIKKAYQSTTLTFMEGEYYLYSPQDFSAPWYDLKGFKTLGMIEISAFTRFLKSLLISVAYMVAGLIFFMSSTVARFRE